MFSLFLILLFSIFTYSETVNEYLPWHYVQQIAMGPADGGANKMNSIDSNKDGFVDNANNATYSNYAEDANTLDGYNSSELMIGGSGGGVPTGTIAAFNLEECPSGWQPADGEDGRPDLRGMFIRGLNDFGSSAGARSDGYEDPDGIRLLGSFQDDMFQSHTHTVNAGSEGRYNTIADAGGSGRWTGADVTTQSSGGDETRPKNLAFIYCIKENGETQEDLSLFTDTGSQIEVNDGKDLYVDGEKVATEEYVDNNCAPFCGYCVDSATGCWQTNTVSPAYCDAPNYGSCQCESGYTLFRLEVGDYGYLYYTCRKTS